MIKKENMYANYNTKNTTPTTGDNAIKGVKNFLKSKKLSEEDLLKILKDYNRDESQLPMYHMTDEYLIQTVSEAIQKDFGKFVKWFKKTYK